jgi:PPOX class probable F420-dependent enzyme
MASRSALFVALLGICVGAPEIAGSAELGAKKSMDAAVTGKHTVRPVGEAREAKTFASAEVEFLRRPLASQLVTVNPSGTPQVTVMWFRYEDGALLFTTTTDRVKFRNQQRDTRAVFSVVDPTDMYKWIIVHGQLSVDARDPAVFYRGLAEHYLVGEGLEAWRKRATMDKRTVLRLSPTKIRTMGFPQN